MKPRLTEKVLRGLSSLSAEARLAPLRIPRDRDLEGDERAAREWLAGTLRRKNHFALYMRARKVEKKHESAN